MRYPFSNTGSACSERSVVTGQAVFARLAAPARFKPWAVSVTAMGNGFPSLVGRMGRPGNFRRNDQSGAISCSAQVHNALDRYSGIRNSAVSSPISLCDSEVFLPSSA